MVYVWLAQAKTAIVTTWVFLVVFNIAFGIDQEGAQNATSSVGIKVLNISKLPDELVVDVGERELGAPLRGQITLCNKTLEELYLEDIKSGCGCLVPEINETLFAPGKELNIPFALKDATAIGNFSTSLRVSYKGHGTSPLDVVVKWKNIGPVALTSEVIEFKSTDEVNEIGIKPQQGCTIQNCQPVLGHLEVKGQVQEEGVLKLKVSSNFRVGSMTEYLRVQYLKAGQEHTLDIPIRLRNSSPAVFVPASMELTPITPPPGGNSTTEYVGSVKILLANEEVAKEADKLSESSFLFYTEDGSKVEADQIKIGLKKMSSRLIDLRLVSRSEKRIMRLQLDIGNASYFCPIVIEDTISP